MDKGRHRLEAEAESSEKLGVAVTLGEISMRKRSMENE